MTNYFVHGRILHIYEVFIVLLTPVDSPMHMIACGIRRHQNWRIGPSLLGRKKQRRLELWIVRSTEDIVEIRKHICDYRSIYLQLVELELVRTIGVYQCVWRNKLFEERSTLLWGTLREVIISVLTMIEFELGHWIHRTYLVELIPRFRFHIYHRRGMI